jgi:hypothetical protein
MQEGHAHTNCSSKTVCWQTGCGEKHHTTLHDYFTELKNEEEKKKKAAEDKAKIDKTSKEKDTKAVKLSCLASNQASTKVILQIVPIRVHNQRGGFVDTHAILDNCSQTTIIRQDILDELGLKGEKGENFDLTTICRKEEMNFPKLSLEISSRCGGYRTMIKEVFAAPAGKFNMPSRPSVDIGTGENFPHLKDVNLEAVSAKDVTMLIGANSPRSVLHTNVRWGEEGQPAAVETVFGWTLFGNSNLPPKHGPKSVMMNSVEAGNESVETFWNEDEKPPTRFVNIALTQSDELLLGAIESHWKQEHCGILSQKDVAWSKEDEAAMEVMEKESRWTGEKWEVPMLWNSPKVSLPNNYPMAKKRFGHLERKLLGDRELHRKMNDIIVGYLKASPPQAKKLTPGEAAVTSDRTWYCPVFPVSNPNKSKVRPVKDAAARYEGTSLNKNLVTGPDLLNSIPGIIMRFRHGAVTITADIEAMYYQVRVPTADTDSLRFLWKESKEDWIRAHSKAIHLT